MNAQHTDIALKGKTLTVPSVGIGNKTVVVLGRWLRLAVIHAEDWTEGQGVDDPEAFLRSLRATGLRADIFTFAQKIPQVKPKYRYHMEWDNIAAIPITRYQDWWDQISSDMRRDVKIAQKRGVTVRAAPFDDELVNGIMGIHDEVLVKQGTPFVHRGKGFDVVKRDYGTYLGKSQFVGAYHGDELIGLLKIVHVGELACLMQIVSKDRHYDKRPTNALIAKAVELCAEGGYTYLTYGKYFYGNKRRSSLVDFKHRNGFRCVRFPKYYIPLTLRGSIALRLGLHRGLLGILPGFLISSLVDMRARIRRRLLLRSLPPKSVMS